jgi:hypothetical protein
MPKHGLSKGRGAKKSSKGGFEHSSEVDWHSKSGQDNAILGTLHGQEHVPGSQTTKHRPIERARLRAGHEGAHPEHGRFDRSFPDDSAYGPHRMVFAAPSGARVVVDHLEADDKLACPDDRRCAVNGEPMFHGEAREYLKRTRGIHI